MSLTDFFENLIEKQQKKHRNFSNQASNYWMPTSYKEKAEDVNLIELASIRRAVANFVRIQTGKAIPVTFDVAGQSYTDQSEKVTLSADIANDEFDAVVGLALHEGMHIEDTDMSLMQRIIGMNEFGNRAKDIIDLDYRLLKQAKKLNLGDTIDTEKKTRVSDSNGGDDKLIKVGDLLTNLGMHPDEFAMRMYIKDLFNWIEDRRIDKKSYDKAPGYQPYVKAPYRKYFGNDRISEGIKSAEYRTEDWPSYNFRIVNILNPNTDLDALDALRTVWKMLNLKNIKRLGSGNAGSRKALDLAIDIYAFISRFIDPAEQQKRQEEQKQNEQEQKKQQEELQEMMSQMQQGGGSGEENENDDNENDDNENDPENNTDDSTNSGGGRGGK